MASNQERAEARAFNRGLRQGRDEMKNAILKDLQNEIDWIGPKRIPEITRYVVTKYEDMNYKA